MRAFITQGDGLDALRRIDLIAPVPRPHEILVRLSAAALNYRDLLVAKGVDGWKPNEPRIPVSDGVGVVERAGANVTRFRTGDRVAGIFLPRWLDGELTAEVFSGALGGATTDGVLAEYRVFDEQSAVAVPAHLTDAEAATLPCAGVTAWHAVHVRSGVRPGDSVLIQGTGGVSLFALQFVLALGARAIVLSSSDKKLEQVRQLGAADTINYAQVPAWEDEVLARTGGRGVDHVIEVVGGENLNRSLRAVRVSGTISFIGLLAGLAAPINTWQFVAKNVRLHGIETGSRSMFEDMNRFIESGGHFGKVVVRATG